jgi:hypothetical protein
MPRPRTGKALSAAKRRPHRVWSDQRIVEARSLAMHVLAARHIARDPRLLDRARATVERWVGRYGERAPAALLEWQALLKRPWEEVLSRATAFSEEGARLRKSSPLATLLAEDERLRVYEAFRS